MTRASSKRVPGIWHGLLWSLQRGGQGGGISRTRLLWRTLTANLGHGKALRHWMGVVFEMQSRQIISDMSGEYLRAVRPYVHRHTRVTDRVVQLIDHADWLETALKHGAFETLTAGRPLVLAELPAPRGFEYMRLQLRRASPQSPEGELVLSLTLQRTANVQQKAQAVDAAVMGFSRFRIDGVGCLVIGGVRGQRNPVARFSPQELSQALAGWKPSVLMVRVAQELARYWGLRLVGLDPASHQLQDWTYQIRKRYRDAGLRIYASYDALWEHFDAKKGPPGWMILPLDSDEKLEATALSPEKRARQTRRADYWIRTRNALRLQFRDLLLRPDREARLSHLTESMALESGSPDDDVEDSGFGESDDDMIPARVLQTGPGNLV